MTVQHDVEAVQYSTTTSQNPYAEFRVCCAKLYTKDHAQLCGVVSFSLFLCLVVISLMLFDALSIFYIVTGVIVYSLLMKCLFGLTEKMYVLFYLLFEAVQIGFYLALVLYIALPLLFFEVPRMKCESISVELKEGGEHKLTQICKQSILVQEYMELLLFIIILATVKLYFARVFAHFYKFLIFEEKFRMHSAQYVNGRGIQISALGQMFPPPPPGFWDNAVVRDADYGYETHIKGGPQISVARLPKMDELPSYAQAIGHQPQQSSETATAAPTAEQSIAAGNTMVEKQQQKKNTDGVKLHLHV